MKSDKKVANANVIKKVLNEVQKLHSAAYVLAQVSKKVRDPDIQLDDLVNIINNDSALTVEIVQLSNSPYYALPAPAKDLKSAISRIGLHEILKVVTLAVSKNISATPLKHYAHTDTRMWLESMSIALCVEQFAEAFSYDSQVAHTTGLLCTIGKIVVDRVMDENKMDAVFDYSGSKTLVEWEVEHVGFDHAYASAKLLESWKFPEDIVNSVLCHLNPENNPDADALSHGLWFAKQVVDASDIGFATKVTKWNDAVLSFISKRGMTIESLNAGILEAKGKFIALQKDFSTIWY